MLLSKESFTLNDIENEKLFGKLSPIPQKFANAEEYFKSYIVPTKENVRATIQTSLESFYDRPGECNIPARFVNANASVYDFDILFSEIGKYMQYRKIRATDVYLFCLKEEVVNVCPNNFYFFAYVQKVVPYENENGVLTHYRVRVRRLGESVYELEDEILEQKKLYMSLLTSFATAYRILESLERMDIPPWFHLVLDPTLAQYIPEVEQFNLVPADFVARNEVLKGLNSDQVAAVYKGLNDTLEVQLIHGPPGTGKSRCLFALIQLLLKRKELVCFTAPTNIATTEMCRRMIAKMEEDACLGNMLLIGSEDNLEIDAELEKVFLDKRLLRLKEVCTYFKTKFYILFPKLLGDGVEGVQDYLKSLSEASSKLYSYCTILANDVPSNYKYKSFLHTACWKLKTSILRNLDQGLLRMHMDGVNINDELFLNEMSLWSFDGERRPIFLSDDSFQYLRSVRKDLNTFLSSFSSIFDVLDNLKNNLFEIVVSGCRITFSTVSSTGKKIFEAFFAKHPVVVMDEACQVIEAEGTLVLRSTVQRLILAGDPCQLPASVLSHQCELIGYNRSFFQRFYELGYPTSLLSLQYRMHPKVFYNGKLKNDYSLNSVVVDWHSNVHFGPLSFFNVSHGREATCERGKSKYNLQEIEIIGEMVKLFLKKYDKVDRKITVGIITPYAEQMKLINRLMKNIAKKIVPQYFDERKQQEVYKLEIGESLVVDVNTVDGFQGQERDVIIISCVRTGDKVGFVDDWRRLNVAITRAKFSCWIFGHQDTLTKHTTYWKKLINYCAANKKVATKEQIHELIGVEKVEIQELSTRLLDKDLYPLKGEKLLSDSLWEISMKRKSIESAQRMPKADFDKLLHIIRLWCDGRRRGKSSARKMEEKQMSSRRKLIQLENVGKYVILWSVAIRADLDFYKQIIQIWDIFTKDKVNEACFSVQSALQSFTEAYIDLCIKEEKSSKTVDQVIKDGENEQIKSMEVKIVIPLTFYKSDIGKLEFYKSTDTSSDEHEEQGDATVVEKTYSIDVNKLETILKVDLNVKELPFSLSEAENNIVSNVNETRFILGRSGTGKTTVALYKMYQRTLSSFYLVSNNEENVSIKQLLVTASPRLCQSIKDYWRKLSANLEDNLIKVTQNLLNNLKVENCDKVSVDEIKDIKLDLELELNIQDEIDSEDVKVDDGQKYDDVISNMPDFMTFRQFMRYLNSRAARHEKFAGLKNPSNPDANEITFERFKSNYYIHFPTNSKKSFDASFMWKEFQSVIKGSLSVIGSQHYLDQAAYVAESKKRISIIDEEERELLYNCFQSYERRKEACNEYDLGDVTLHFYLFLRFGSGLKNDLFHFVTIDEVQDLTPLQIYLFKFACTNVNGFLFAGDTAQTIAAGVGFRFEDIRSLFYTEFLKGLDRKIVSEISFLTQNYRSHSGVLNLAASIVDTLIYFFPNTIDKLPRENALVRGKLPTFLESIQVDALLLSLFGKNEAMTYEFGSEQCILVRNEESRKVVSDILPSSALILTIEESKGLEFNDVLVYNFFADSSSNWRLLYHMFEKGAVKVPDFDNKKHQQLCQELKLLYVAVTRAKSNLWLFDGDKSKREPVVDYWKTKSLVKVYEEAYDGASIVPLAKRSSKEEWQKRGFDFYNKENYTLARRCFEQAGDNYNAKSVLVLELREKAESFAVHDKSQAKSLNNQIGKILMENLNKPVLAAEYFVKAMEYKKAYNIYVNLEMHTEAFDVTIKAKLFNEGLELMETVGEKLNQRKVQDFLYKYAVNCHSNRSPAKDIETVVSRFPDVRKKKLFYERYGYENQLMILLNQEQDFVALANRHCAKGEFIDASIYFGKVNKSQERISCLSRAVVPNLIYLWEAKNIDISRFFCHKLNGLCEGVPSKELDFLKACFECEDVNRLIRFLDDSKQFKHIQFALASKLLLSSLNKSKLSTTVMTPLECFRTLYPLRKELDRYLELILNKRPLYSDRDKGAVSQLLSYFGIFDCENQNYDKCFMEQDIYNYLQLNRLQGKKVLDLKVTVQEAFDLIWNFSHSKIKFYFDLIVSECTEYLKSCAPCDFLVPFMSKSAECPFIDEPNPKTGKKCPNNHDMDKLFVDFKFLEALVYMIVEFSEAKRVDNCIRLVRILFKIAFSPNPLLLKNPVDRLLFLRSVTCQELINNFKSTIEDKEDLFVEGNNLAVTRYSDYGIHKIELDSIPFYEMIIFGDKKMMAIKSIRTITRCWGEFHFDGYYTHPLFQVADKYLVNLFRYQYAMYNMGRLEFISIVEQFFVSGIIINNRKFLLMPRRFGYLFYENYDRFVEAIDTRSSDENFRLNNLNIVFIELNLFLKAHGGWLKDSGLNQVQKSTCLTRIAVLLLTFMLNNFYPGLRRCKNVFQNILAIREPYFPSQIFESLRTVNTSEGIVTSVLHILKRLGDECVCLGMFTFCPLPKYYPQRVPGDVSSLLAALDPSSALTTNLEVKQVSIKEERKIGLSLSIVMKLKRWLNEVRKKLNKIQDGDNEEIVENKIIFSERILTSLKLWMANARKAIELQKIPLNAKDRSIQVAEIYFKKRKVDVRLKNDYIEFLISRKHKLLDLSEEINFAQKEDLFVETEEFERDDIIEAAFNAIDEINELVKKIEDLKELFKGSKDEVLDKIGELRKEADKIHLEAMEWFKETRKKIKKMKNKERK